jgi:hypothetical protein
MEIAAACVTSPQCLRELPIQTMLGTRTKFPHASPQNRRASIAILPKAKSMPMVYASPHDPIRLGPRIAPLVRKRGGLGLGTVPDQKLSTMSQALLSIC